MTKRVGSTSCEGRWVEDPDGSRLVCDECGEVTEGLNAGEHRRAKRAWGPLPGYVTSCAVGIVLRGNEVKDLTPSPGPFARRQFAKAARALETLESARRFEPPN